MKEPIHTLQSPHGCHEDFGLQIHLEFHNSLNVGYFSIGTVGHTEKAIPVLFPNLK